MRVCVPAMIWALLALCSCQSPPEPKAEAPSHLSVEAARNRAQKDFAAGKPVVFVAGGYASYEPGIAESQKPLVAGLPRNNSMAGCTNPLVSQSVSFATAYNKEMVRLLQRSGPQ